MIKVCFRNDDVNTFTPELEKVTDIFVSRGIPITHGVEPANMTAQTVRWLRYLKQRNPDLIEIVQHGWNHQKHGRGEFCSARSYEQQLMDLRNGFEKMTSEFENDFFPALTIPFGVYSADTIKAANSVGYKVFYSHYNYRVSRRMFYLVGHILGKGQVLGRRISNHLRRYPGTEMLQIDTSISFIRKYFDDFGTGCQMFSVREIMAIFRRLERLIPVVVLLLHHRYFIQKDHLRLVHDVLDQLERRRDIQYVTCEELHREYFH